MYNGKTRLVVTFHQYDKRTSAEENFVELRDKIFNTYDEALEEMDQVMPRDYMIDDGDYREEWDDLINNGEDAFLQFNADISVDGSIYMLAQLFPIKN